MSVTVPLE